MKDSEQDLEQQIGQAAWQVRQKAYAPYSGFKVGAALLADRNNEVICGTNVENASYGATICAERSALVNLVTKHGMQRVRILAVATDADDPAVPCAMCLQVMAEFCLPSTQILLVNSTGIVKRFSFEQVLPYPFTSFKA